MDVCLRVMPRVDLCHVNTRSARPPEDFVESFLGCSHVNFVIFPDLKPYKAVQRSSGAIAIGPVLQGLLKPANDLSRGAPGRDILNTVAITAIQAQSS